MPQTKGAEEMSRKKDVVCEGCIHAAGPSVHCITTHTLRRWKRKIREIHKIYREIGRIPGDDSRALFADMSKVLENLK